MSEMVEPLAIWCAAIVEVLGIATITFFTLFALLKAGIQLIQKAERGSVYQELRHLLGRGILLGLELLIAADIIHTVAVDLNFNNVGVLAIIVLIRTFLSFALELELTDKWPWQQNAAARSPVDE